MKRELWYTSYEVRAMLHSKVTSVFEDYNGILTTQMAYEHGINASTLRKAVERQDIQKYSRGIYLLDDMYFDDLYLLQLKYPKGVFSYETAVMLHWLSTNYPFVYHMSFPRGYHLVDAKEQNIKSYYVSKNETNDEYLEVVDSWDGNPLRVTNLEKTIVDMLRYKEATPGIVDEMLDDYLGREDKNLERLKQYARKFDIESLLNEKDLPIVK